MNYDELMNGLATLLQNGSEEEARTFLTDHYLDFPEEIREKIGFAFLAEALTQQAAEMEAVSDVQRQGLTMLDALGAVKRELENVARIDELKTQLSA
jgi:hypothetical protein